MASYVETLEEDHERVRLAIEGLIAEQQSRIDELQEELAGLCQRLDKLILRTLIFRNTYGAGATDTFTAEGNVEEASKPVTEITRQLEREKAILRGFQAALEQAGGGAQLADLGKPAVLEGAEIVP